MRNGEVGVKYVKDGELGWIPVVRRRRKKSARSEESESSGNVNVNNKRRSLVMYRKVDGIPRIYIRESLKAARQVVVKPSPIASRTRTKRNII